MDRSVCLDETTHVAEYMYPAVNTSQEGSEVIDIAGPCLLIWAMCSAISSSGTIALNISPVDAA